MQNDDLRSSRNNSTWKNLSSVLEVKLVLLGTTDVGKTSISQRYCMGTFQDSSKPTVGGSFLAKTITVEGIKLKLQIWDTAGQERFRSLAPMYYRGAAAAILVFDILNYDSFEKVKDWVRELRFNNQEDLILSVVGNKIDLEEQREVQRQEAADYSTSIGASYHETSAKDNKGIEELFIQIGKKLHQRQLEKPIQYSSHFNDDKNLVHPSSNPRLNNANSSNQNSNSNSNSCC